MLKTEPMSGPHLRPPSASSAPRVSALEMSATCNDIPRMRPKEGDSVAGRMPRGQWLPGLLRSPCPFVQKCCLRDRHGNERLNIVTVVSLHPFTFPSILTLRVSFLLRFPSFSFQARLDVVPSLPVSPLSSPCKLHHGCWGTACPRKEHKTAIA